MPFTPNPEDEAAASFTPNPEDQPVDQTQKTEPGGLFTQIKLGIQQIIPKLSENLYNTMAGLAEAGKEKALGVIQGLPIVPRSLQLQGGTAVLEAPEKFRELADVGAGISQQIEEVGQKTLGPDLARQITSQAGSVAPALAAAPFGFPAMVGVAGLQSFGSTYREAREAYLKDNPAPEAEKKAVQAGLVSGITTALVTAAFGKTGLESVTESAKNVGVKAAISNIFKEAGLEATEEAVDQMFQEMEAYLSYNPEKTVADAVHNTVVAGMAGGILSSAVVAPVNIAETTLSKIGPATKEAVSGILQPQPVGIVSESSASLAGIVNKIGELLRPKSISDNPQIKEAIKEKDVIAGREWINSPEYLFRNDPVAAPLVSKLVEAQLDYTAKAGQDDSRFEELSKDLSLDQLQLVTKKMREAQEGNPNAVDQLPDELKPFAKELRTYFDEWRTKVQENKKQRIVESMPDAQRKVLEDILGGTDKATAFKNSKLKDAGKASVESALNEIDDVSKWGIENYITNAERGNWRIVDQDGTTVAVSESKTEAAIKAEKYLKDNPGTTQLTLTDEFDPGVVWPTQLSQPAYFRLLNNAKEALGTTAQEMQDILRETAPLLTVKPTNKYSKFMQQRRGVLKGEENVMDILPAYIYSMHKKTALDPLLREARNTLPKLQPNTRTAIEHLVTDIKGRKYLGDRIADSLLHPLGLKPFAYSSFVNVARNISAHMKLGFRPISVLINRLGGIHHTWTKTGFVDLMEGKKWVKSDEGKKVLEANKNLIGLEASLATESGVVKEEPWYKPLGLFQKMEHFNRPEAFGAFYIQGKKRFGMGEDEAIEYARKSVRSTQFVYNIASLPEAMRGPTGRLVFQFKPYLLKEIEFLTTLSPAEWGRYLTGFIALGGPRAALIVMRSLPVLGALGFLGGIEDWLNTEYPRLFRGVPGALGVDVSSATAPQLPQTPEEFAGPVVGDLMKLANQVIIPAIKGEEKDWNDVRKWAVKLAPMVYYMEQAVQASMEENGWIKDQRGRNKFQPDKWDKAKLLLGTKPLNQSVEEVETRYLNEVEDIAQKNRQHYLDDLADAIQSDDSTEIDKLVGMAEDYGFVTGKDLSSAIKNNIRGRELKPLERTFRRMMRSKQAEESERLNP